jgi:hypothetical protein
VFGINDQNSKHNPLPDDKLTQMRLLLDYTNVCLLIIDEVSTIDANIISRINLRLQQIFGNKLRFGGLPIIFSGDFNQLGPVKKCFIPKLF